MLICLHNSFYLFGHRIFSSRRTDFSGWRLLKRVNSSDSVLDVTFLSGLYRKALWTVAQFLFVLCFLLCTLFFYLYTRRSDITGDRCFTLRGIISKEIFVTRLNDRLGVNSLILFYAIHFVSVFAYQVDGVKSILGSHRPTHPLPSRLAESCKVFQALQQIFSRSLLFEISPELSLVVIRWSQLGSLG